MIENERIDYVCITLRRNFLSLYFEANSGFKKVAEFGGGQIQIYEVKKVKPYFAFETRISEATSDFLKNLKNKRLNEFENLRTRFFKEKLGLSEEEIDKIMTGEYPLVELYAIY